MRSHAAGIALRGGLLLALAGCHAGVPGPARLDTRNETCRFCRMPVSDARYAAQLVAPGEEPLFFDDIGCLEAHLGRSQPVGGAVAYVADHRTRAWVMASAAVFSRIDGLETPMNSHLVAHASAASRDADPVARGAPPVFLAHLSKRSPAGEGSK